MWIYTSTPIRLHSVALNSLSTGTKLIVSQKYQNFDIFSEVLLSDNSVFKENKYKYNTPYNIVHM
jgi:hypothetical protein